MGVALDVGPTEFRTCICGVQGAEPWGASPQACDYQKTCSGSASSSGDRRGGGGYLLLRYRAVGGAQLDAAALGVAAHFQSCTCPVQVRAVVQREARLARAGGAAGHDAD